MLTIDLLRHGALQGGIKYRGMCDDLLTPEGRECMDAVWANIKGEVTSIVSSPLSRCCEPAQAWAKEIGVDCVIEAKVQELDYGAWEGLTAVEIESHSPGVLKKWRSNPTHMQPPQGELMSDFSSRTQFFLDDLIERYQNDHVLVVAHSGTIRMLLAHVLSAPVIATRHFSMPYACWSRVQVESGHASLLFHDKLGKF